MDPTPHQPRTALELHHGPVVLHAWAPWCGSCRALAPVVDEVAEQSGIAVAAIRVDTSPETVERFAVRSVPTLIALRNGNEVGRLVGLQHREAVESLFAGAAGSGIEIRNSAPTSLVAVRAVSAAALGLAGLITGSLALGSIGAALAVWALLGLIRR